MSYRSDITKWVNEMKSEYGEYLGGYPMVNFNDASDDQLEGAAKAMHGYIKMSMQAKKVATPHTDNEILYLVPEIDKGGSFRYWNKVSGKVEVIVDKMPNGHFSFFGPRKYLEILGGRGSLSGIVDRMADGDYFNKG